ncbi:regulatory protein RecX [Aeromonas dhakensis]|uniref:regulatory protein RecX n=1 Tax=Aeromonas dhakensis TaxID=196024 RepID=UPI00191F0DF2|nr:regulatory protein RecX [Aeromonas dhakensis]MDD9305818.1 recombination regulator RecX [Aeromonas hydrophila]MBL0600497.1 regulatory protein RecX [Aeromonas dhakensis]MBL0618774.1 regulatory protein RecX [Aeromonas dhakensis]MBL0660006.1 regulatory protein RecX [Aeromonas dhakensis]UCM47338.1 recombination regulator RecX [Aeromonas dhakensis]
MVDESVTEPVEPAEPTFAEQLAAARAYAMRSLARRESAESELARRLRQQGYQEEVIEAVVDYCRGYNWVNDERYGAMAVRAGAAKGHGPLKIRFDLRRKGLDDGQIDAAFEQPELDWFELALELLERRANLADLADFKLRMKWLKYLLGRGFSQDQARYAISALQEREE